MPDTAINQESFGGGQPLAGKHFLLTRPANEFSCELRDDSSPLMEDLEKLGAKIHVIHPLLIQPVDQGGYFDQALRSIGLFDWIVFTSVHGVEATFERMAEMKIDLRDYRDVKLAAIGPRTASHTALRFRSPDLTAEESIQESLALAFSNVKDEKILYFRANLARNVLPTLLREKGAIVQDIVAYNIVRNLQPGDLPKEVPDGFLFTSSESASVTIDLLKQEGDESWLNVAPLFCIGPMTAKKVMSYGYAPCAVKKNFNSTGLVELVVSYFTKGAGFNE